MSASTELVVAAGPEPEPEPEPEEQQEPERRPSSRKKKRRKKGAKGAAVAPEEGGGEALVPRPSAGGDGLGKLASVAEGDEGDEDGDRLSLEVVPLEGEGGGGGGEGAGTIVPAGDAPSPLGWKERAMQKKQELVLKKQALKERAAELRSGELGSAGGCFRSEAAFDAWIDKLQIILLVFVLVCEVGAYVTPWAYAASSYVAPFDGAEAELDVTLWLWSGDFHLAQQQTDPPPPPPLQCFYNEHVADGVCVPCARGWTRLAGDDRTAGDTECVSERGFVITFMGLNQSEVNASDPALQQLTLPRPPPPPATSSGPLVDVVDASAAYGGRIDLAPGMHQGIMRVFELSGAYQLPPASGGLWTARLLLLCSAILACAAIHALRQLGRYHRAATKRALARRRRAMLDPPENLIHRSRGLVVLLALSSVVGFALAHNATVPVVGGTVVRCCSMFAASCGAQTTVHIGAAVALLGAIAAALA